MELRKIVASTPCSREYSQQLIERFKRWAKLKAYIQLTKILKIRSKRRIMIRIKPTIKILQSIRIEKSKSMQDKGNKVTRNIIHNIRRKNSTALKDLAKACRSIYTTWTKDILCHWKLQKTKGCKWNKFFQGIPIMQKNQFITFPCITITTETVGAEGHISYSSICSNWFNY